VAEGRPYEVRLKRRSRPDQLRYLAELLRVSGGDRAKVLAVEITLRMIADEMEA
jgi:hypothetical protein